jgi:hypothetical protein
MAGAEITTPLVITGNAGKASAAAGAGFSGWLAQPHSSKGMASALLIA